LTFSPHWAHAESFFLGRKSAVLYAFSAWLLDAISILWAAFPAQFRIMQCVNRMDTEGMTLAGAPDRHRLGQSGVHRVVSEVLPW
jgi:hypothetical protein